MTLFNRFSLILVCVAFAGAGVSAEETRLSTTLDASSSVDFERTGSFAVPPATSIDITFGDADRTGGVPVRLALADVSVPPILLGGARGELVVALDQPAEGMARRASDGSVALDIRAIVRVTHDGGSRRYPLRFTTGESLILARDGSVRASSRGSNIDPRTGEFTLVATTVTAEEILGGPEEAVVVSLRATTDSELPPVLSASDRH